MNPRSLSLVVLGQGKTGSLVAEVAGERGHRVQSIDADVNENAAWLTPKHLQDVHVAIDFTEPRAVLTNIEACLRAKKAMVVGTTGWYGEMERIRSAVEKAGTGFVFGANFSYGVNLFCRSCKRPRRRWRMAIQDISPNAITFIRRMRPPELPQRFSECWSRPPESAPP